MKQKRWQRYVTTGVFCLLVAAIGTIGYRLIAAATVIVSSEAEAGTVQTAENVVDNSASGGKALQFRTAPVAGKPWGSRGFYVDADNTASSYARNNPGRTDIALIARMGQQPVSAWFGNWNADVRGDAERLISRAAAAGKVPIAVAYNIPNRDCGGYSAGGSQAETDYVSWIARLADGFGDRPVIIIVEPDALPLTHCLSTEQLAARWRMLSSAVTTLARNPNAAVYIDAGHSNWLSVQETADRLKLAGVAKARGFSLNVSNFQTTASNVAFGNQVAALLGGKHFVVDTGRNGNGPTSDAQWCNPLGRALGDAPTSATSSAAADAYLWIKTPWESDGSCNGNPDAGQPNWQYAIDMAKAARW